MSEHTEAGKECIARVVHELVPTIARNFWKDDPHNGDVIQHLYFLTGCKFQALQKRRKLIKVYAINFIP